MRRSLCWMPVLLLPLGSVGWAQEPSKPAVSRLDGAAVKNDSDIKTRRDTILRLAKAGPAAKEALPQLIAAFKDAKTRLIAGYALARIGEASLPPLIGSSALAENTAERDGGGIYDGLTGIATLNECTVRFNRAATGGGIVASETRRFFGGTQRDVGRPLAAWLQARQAPARTPARRCERQR